MYILVNDNKNFTFFLRTRDVGETEDRHFSVFAEYLTVRTETVSRNFAYLACKNRKRFCSSSRMFVSYISNSCSSH